MIRARTAGQRKIAVVTKPKGMTSRVNRSIIQDPDILNNPELLLW